MMISFLLAWTVLHPTSPIGDPIVPANQIGTSTPETATPLAAPVGLVFRDNRQPRTGPLNFGTLIQQQVTHINRLREKGVEYLDNCGRGERVIGSPYTVNGYGTETVYNGPVTPYFVGRPETSAWFISEKTPPAPGLRVIVRNATTQSALDKMPYADREYDKGDRSEGFVAALETRHRGQFLAVQLGVNQFIYAIKRGDQVVESGQFTANFTQETQNTSTTETIPRRKENLKCVDVRANKSGKNDHKYKDEYRHRRQIEESKH
jgi:hypothetical protein